MEKIHITRVAVSDKNKAGEPYVNKFTGKVQKRIGIQCVEYGDKWLSDFISNPSDIRLGWKAGDEATVIVEEKGDFVNFHLPDRNDLLEQRVDAIEKFLMK